MDVEFLVWKGPLAKTSEDNDQALSRGKQGGQGLCQAEWREQTGSLHRPEELGLALMHSPLFTLTSATGVAQHGLHGDFRRGCKSPFAVSLELMPQHFFF